MKNKNKTANDISNEINKALKLFLITPSDENLNIFYKLCSEYKETWIQESSFYKNKSELNIQPINEEKIIENLKYENTDLKSAMELEIADPEYISQKTNKVKSQLVTKEIARANSEDENIKILTQSIKHSNNIVRLGETEQEIKPIDFHQHAIRAIRESNPEDDKKSNRRWYFEKEGESKLAWWCKRDQMMSVIEYANSKGMFKKALDNDDLSDIKVIKSMELDRASYDEYLKSFTLFEERNAIFNSNKEVFFIIFESLCARTKEQIGQKILEESILNFEPSMEVWRDICIFDSTQVTIRSVTSDERHKPSVKVLDSDWYISNDMSNLSNQAMREFIKVIHPELNIND